MSPLPNELTINFVPFHSNSWTNKLFFGDSSRSKYIHTFPYRSEIKFIFWGNPGEKLRLKLGSCIGIVKWNPASHIFNKKAAWPEDVLWLIHDA